MKKFKALKETRRRRSRPTRHDKPGHVQAGMGKPRQDKTRAGMGKPSQGMGWHGQAERRTRHGQAWAGVKSLTQDPFFDEDL